MKNEPLELAVDWSEFEPLDDGSDVESLDDGSEVESLEDGSEAEPLNEDSLDGREEASFPDGIVYESSLGP